MLSAKTGRDAIELAAENGAASSSGLIECRRWAANRSQAFKELGEYSQYSCDYRNRSGAPVTQLEAESSGAALLSPNHSVPPNSLRDSAAPPEPAKSRDASACRH